MFILSITNNLQLFFFRQQIKLYFLCLALLASGPLLVSAADIYKYKDENGDWKYSDRSSGHADSQVLQINDSSEVKVFAQVWVKEVVGGTPSLSIINRYFGPVQATLDLECNHCEIKNKSKRFILEARGQEFAFKLDPKIKNWRAKYSLGVVLGDPKAEPDDYRYRLPFPELVGYLITQSFNGPFSHQDEANLYSIDVALPLATPVLAARGGIVMGVEESNTEAGVTEEYGEKANTIYILHSDGTIGVYAHLDMYSASVSPGDSIEVGDYLARSGNTGFSTGPHLHFSIWANDNGVQKSVHYQFDNGAGGVFHPHAGSLVTHGYGKVKLEVQDEYKGLYDESVDRLESLNSDNNDLSVKNSSSDDESLVDKTLVGGMNYLRILKEYLNTL